jgi:hypothetical protein
MMNIDKGKDWIRENIPMLTVVFENKYLGMLYDRFASLPGAKQKQVIIGSALAVVGVVLIHLSYSYFSLWSNHHKIGQTGQMVGQLKAFQKQEQEQSGEIRLLERNAALAGEGNLKSHLISLSRNAGISPRMIQADESNDGGTDLQMKRANLKLQRINLTQLKTLLQGVEFGSYSLEVSSIKTKNDDKIRGYMDVELGVVAYLFGATGDGT